MTNATRLTLVTDAHRSAISRNLSTISIQASPGVSVICHTGRIHGTTAEIPSLFPAIGKACILRLNVSYHWRERRDLLADGYSHAARLADQWPAKPFVVVDQREDHEPYAEFLQLPRDRGTLQDRSQSFAGRNNPCFLPGNTASRTTVLVMIPIAGSASVSSRLR
jgi:hypothetical protein